jgi:hypothetical protein
MNRNQWELVPRFLPVVPKVIAVEHRFHIGSYVGPLYRSRFKIDVK